MLYNAPFKKSKTDTEYDGNERFQWLYEGRETKPFEEGRLPVAGWYPWYLNELCYTVRGINGDEARAYILLDTPLPTPESKVRLILNLTKYRCQTMEYLEVIPAPDNEWSMFPNQWARAAKEFISGRSFHIGYYEVLCGPRSRNLPTYFKHELFDTFPDQPAHTYLADRRYADILNFVAKEARKNSDRFGCAQRNRDYASLLERHAARWNCRYMEQPVLWGSYDKSTQRVKPDHRNEITIYGLMFNELCDLIDKYTAEGINGVIKDEYLPTVIQAFDYAIHKNIQDEYIKLKKEHYTVADLIAIRDFVKETFYDAIFLDFL